MGRRSNSVHPGFRRMRAGLPSGLLRLLPPKLLSRVARLSSGLAPGVRRTALLAELTEQRSAQGRLTGWPVIQAPHPEIVVQPRLRICFGLKAADVGVATIGIGLDYLILVASRNDTICVHSGRK